MLIPAFALVMIPVALFVFVLRTYSIIRNHYGRMAQRAAHLALASHGVGLAVLCWLLLKRYGSMYDDAVRVPVLLGIPVGLFFCATGIKYARGDADARLLVPGALQAAIGIFLVAHNFQLDDPWRGIPVIIGWTVLATGIAKIAILMIGHPQTLEGEGEEYPYGHQVIDQAKAEKSLKE